MKKIALNIAVVLIGAYTMSLSMCSSSSNNSVNDDPCHETDFVSPTADTWVNDMIVEENGAYRDYLTTGDAVLAIDRIVANSVVQYRVLVQGDTDQDVRWQLYGCGGDFWGECVSNELSGACVLFTNVTEDDRIWPVIQ